MISRDKIVELYLAMFQRAPTKMEVDYWYNNYKDYDSLSDVADDMFTAAVDAVKSYNLQELYPMYADIDLENLSSSYEQVKDIISSVYKVLLNKDETTDKEGIEYWSFKVINLEATIGEVIANVITITEEIANDPAKADLYFNNEEEKNSAIKAANSFKVKLDLAKEVEENIEKIDENKDLQSQLSELKKVVEEVKSEDDIPAEIEKLIGVKKDNNVEISNEIDDHIEDIAEIHEKDIEAPEIAMYINNDNELNDIIYNQHHYDEFHHFA